MGPLAKENLRHQFDPPYGVEYDPAWRDDAKSSDGTIKRWEQFTGETATLETDGRTFAEIAAARHQEAA